MSKFSGFPARMQFTPVPNLFLSSLLPDITDIAELKITLNIFRAVYGRKGSFRYVSYNELLSDKSLVDSIREGEKPVEETLRIALSSAVERGTVITLTMDRDGNAEQVYFLNTEADRQAAGRIKNGEMALSGFKAAAAPPELDNRKPVEIFTLYEENIGMLTPMIAEELKQAEKLYPKAWIEEAIKESVNLNKRNWRYIERILENWSREGKSGTNRRDNKTAPDKFSRQKYGHMVQH